jgi:arylsulfatase
MAGWTLYLRDGIPRYTYNYLGHDITTISGEQPLTEGARSVTLSFAYDGGGLGKGGNATLGVDGTTVATGRVENTVPFLFSMSGETLDVGVDTGSPVGPYPNEFRFTGAIDRIDVTVLPDTGDHRDALTAGQLRGALGTQ